MPAPCLFDLAVFAYHLLIITTQSLKLTSVTKAALGLSSMLVVNELLEIISLTPNIEIFSAPRDGEQPIQDGQALRVRGQHASCKSCLPAYTLTLSDEAHSCPADSISLRAHSIGAILTNQVRAPLRHC